MGSEDDCFLLLRSVGPEQLQEETAAASIYTCWGLVHHEYLRRSEEGDNEVWFLPFADGEIAELHLLVALKVQIFSEDFDVLADLGVSQSFDSPNHSCILLIC